MRAHAHGAVQDGLFERAAGASVDVVLRERALGGGHFGDRFVERALLRSAAVEDAGLVEMDMRLDEASQHQASVEMLLRRLAAKVLRERHDAAASDPDIECLAAACKARIAQDEIEPHGGQI